MQQSRSEEKIVAAALLAAAAWTAISLAAHRVGTRSERPPLNPVTREPQQGQMRQRLSSILT